MSQFQNLLFFYTNTMANTVWLCQPQTTDKSKVHAAKYHCQTKLHSATTGYIIP